MTDLDELWGRVNNGGPPPQAADGAAQQKQQWEQTNQQLQANGYLPPGITRQGLINGARDRARQSSATTQGIAGGATAQLDPYSQSMLANAQGMGISYEQYIANQKKSGTYVPSAYDRANGLA